MAADTATKKLKDMSLADLILSEESLDNIVENNELNARLQGYATADAVDAVSAAVDSKLSCYAALSAYESLLARVEQLELSAQQTSSYASDKDKLCTAAQQLCTMLDGNSISVVNEYDANIARAGTIYFVKSSEDDTLSAIHFTAAAADAEDDNQSVADDGQSTGDEQSSENNSEENNTEEQPPVAASRKRKAKK